MNTLVLLRFTLHVWALVSGVGSINVSIPEKVYEHTRGDNVTLPCTFKTKLTSPSLVIVIWSALRVKEETEDTVIVHFYSHNGRADYTSKYEGRAKVDVKVATGKADLRLYSITMDENRSYECKVQIPGDDEGTPADIAQMVVLGVNIPQMHYQQVKGDNVSVPCYLQSRIPNPQMVSISWSALTFKEDDKMLLTSECNPFDGGMRFLEKGRSSTKRICKPSCCEEILILTHVSSSTEEKTIFQPEYEGRVVVERLDGAFVLKLFNATVTDNTFLMCQAQIPEDEKGVLEAVAKLIVNAPPSPPVCKVEGKPEQGQNISLSCLSEESFPQAVYSWDVPNWTNATRNTHRRSVLFLTNINDAVSGLYTCTSRNKLKAKTCNINLSVSPASTFEASNCGLGVCINRVISTAIVFVLICAIVVYFCCRQRKKSENRKEESDALYMNAVVTD